MSKEGWEREREREGETTTTHLVIRKVDLNLIDLFLNDGFDEQTRSTEVELIVDSVAFRILRELDVVGSATIKPQNGSQFESTRLSPSPSLPLPHFLLTSKPAPHPPQPP